MLWDLSVSEQRYQAVLEAGAGVPVTEVAEQYGVSQQSVHTWLRRYRAGGALAGWRIALTGSTTIRGASRPRSRRRSASCAAGIPSRGHCESNCFR
jgi:transposase-like protein